MFNHYFAVESPFRIWKHVGHSDSNTWIGRSRAITTVMHAANTQPGDQIHALVGGTFLVRGDVCFPISVRAPKDILEKSYGYQPDWQIIEGYVKAGRASKIDAPAQSADYNAGRKLVQENRLPPLRPQVMEIEHSPEYERLSTALAPVIQELQSAGVDIEMKLTDIDAYNGVKAIVKAEGQQFKFYIFNDFRIRAIVPENRFAGDPSEAEQFREGTVWLSITDDQASERVGSLMRDAFVTSAAKP